MLGLLVSCLVEDLGAMVGEISPDMMFWGCWKKWSNVDEDGHVSVLMGACACISKQGSKNEAKRDIIG